MKVLVLGATGGTGRLIVRDALVSYLLLRKQKDIAVNG